MAKDSITYRAASEEHHTGILAVLEEVAPEIPVDLNSTDKQETIKAIIIQCCASGNSLVAVDAEGAVVGFVLAKPDFHQFNATSMRYIGVSKASRNSGIFAELMRLMMAKGVTLTASVLQGNQSHMAKRLTNLKFAENGSDDAETKLKWTPPK